MDSAAVLPKKRILVLAPFFGEGTAWIDDFCKRPDFEFKKFPYSGRELSWHARGSVTPLRQWLRHFAYTYRAMSWKADCIVTCFPQLAICAALLLALRQRNTRLLAWHFNIGSLANGAKGWFAGHLLARADRIVVHAREEIPSYANWLGLDETKFRFVPLQKGAMTNVGVSPIAKPYIVSMGSANRDYKTLIEAIAGTDIKTVVVSKKGEIDRLPSAPNLVKLHGLTQDACNAILSGAEICVVPLAASDSASGQVTFLAAMRLGVATIATRTGGTLDYFDEGETGLLVPPNDPKALRDAIVNLWRDSQRRTTIGVAAKAYAEQRLSDEAAAKIFEQMIDELLVGTPLALEQLSSMPARKHS